MAEILEGEKIAEFEAVQPSSAIDTGNVYYIEFYTGKVKRNGRTEKTGRVYWQIAVYKDGKRQRRISPKSFDSSLDYDGSTTIENCPFTGRVEAYYWKRQKRTADAQNSVGRSTGNDAALPENVDWKQGRQDLYLH